jgi:hypothetical protein
MKEITKKILLNQILESQNEMNEMADYNPGREEKNPWDETPEERAARGLDPNYFQRKSKVTPLHFERPAANQPEAEKTAPDMFVYNDPFEEGKKIVVVQKPGMTILTEEQLQAENPKFHTWAKSQGKLLFLEVANKVKHDPLEVSKANPSKAALKYRGQLGVEFPEKEATRVTTTREKILRNLLNPMVRQAASQINDSLVAAGIPPIETPERMYKSQKENINNYTMIDNDNVSWETQNTYFYETVKDYIQNAKEMYTNKPITKAPRLSHLVRRYNPGRNWSPVRKSEKMDTGYKQDPLTPVLKLDKRGYSAHDYDVELVSLFNLKGSPTQTNEGGTAFKWTVQFKTNYGKKLREESVIRGGLVEDKFLQSEAVTGPMEKLVGPDGTIASNPEISDALNRAIADIVGQINTIEPKEELRNRFSGVGRMEAFREVNESTVIDSIVNKVINELKQ